MSFDINKYMGVWYQLIYYPSWFQESNSYNTTAVYQIINNQIYVYNSNIVNGQQNDSYGTAKVIKDYQLRVDFPMSEVNKFDLNDKSFLHKDDEPNYIIDYIWEDCQGQYIFSVVTDLNKESLYVLSRLKHPSLSMFNKVMDYVTNNYNVKKLVQSPHY